MYLCIYIYIIGFFRCSERRETQIRRINNDKRKERQGEKRNDVETKIKMFKKSQMYTFFLKP